MKLNEEQYLAHYGILRRSGRYPWGSGGPENASNRGFLDYVEMLKKQGLTEAEIARGMGIGKEVNGKFYPSTTALRAAKSIARNQEKQAEIANAQRLKDKGYSNAAIGARLGGKGESYVRTLLAPGAKDRSDLLTSTADMLKREVADKRLIDVGIGNESRLGISQTRFNTAVAMLEEEGYKVHKIKIPIIGTEFNTTRKVLAPPGTPWKDVQQNRDKVQLIGSFSENGGRDWPPVKKHPLVSIHPDRIGINYAADGGGKADGVIFVRPGVEDVNMGTARYAQVRIKVGDGHFLKGMAMYKDELPEGKDLVFNTSKDDTGNKLDAMKPLEPGDFPFGSDPRPLLVNPNDPVKEHVVSAMNIVNEEGDWGDWSKSLSSQILSKQSPNLAKAQLDVIHERRLQEFENIKALTNPTIKKKLLETFAEGTDSAAVHLKAAHLPRQASYVILPVASLPDTQIYAPKYRDEERVVLIRHPHGGTFEIPELVVNNKHAESRRLLGDSGDAIGINHNVAKRLSGADFDGDTVLVIPNNSGKIKTTPALEGLKDFDALHSYPKYDGMSVMTKRQKGIEMGLISNLITDMTILNAPHSEIARAVRHSMVVIDAEKHELNYRQSAIDNGISQLRQKYLGSSKKGASTLISKAKNKKSFPDRKLRPQSEGGPVDRATGRKVFVDTNRMKIDAKGNEVPATKRLKQLAVAEDAHSLVSEANTPIERVYADHSNKLKELANQARLAAINTPRLVKSASAATTYADEVRSLNSKLVLALQNAPLDRQARAIAQAEYRAIKDANPNLDDDALKKIKYRILTKARIRMGAGKQLIKIEPREWDAIQAGAISDSKLGKILNNANLDVLRERATPRVERKMSNNMTLRAKQMLADGYTRAAIADQLGVSTSTLDRATKEVSGG